MTSPTDHITNSTPFHFGLNNNNNNDHDLKYNCLVSPTYQASSSSSHSSYHHFFFNSTTDQAGHYNHHHTEYYMPQHQPEVDNDGVSYDLVKKNKVGSGLKLTLWKREDKLLSSKIKDSDQARMKNTTNNACIKLKLEDQTQQPSSQSDYSSNSSNNIPVRVCADCNTTKTPLWRSGPKGPKSLCNACGIRQRKARRAMAEAANGKTHTTDQTSSSSTMKIKVQHKEKTTKVNTNHVKKRCKFGPSSSSSSAPKKIGNFEDFLMNLSNNLTFHQIFPQDEKEAAILLMALSSGLVHG